MSSSALKKTSLPMSSLARFDSLRGRWMVCRNIVIAFIALIVLYNQEMLSIRKIILLVNSSLFAV